MKFLKMLLSSTLMFLVLSATLQANYTVPGSLNFGAKVILHAIDHSRWVKTSSNRLKSNSTEGGATVFTLVASSSSNDGESVLTETGYLYQSSTGRYVTFDKNYPDTLKLMKASRINGNTSRYSRKIEIKFDNTMFFKIDGKELYIGSDKNGDKMSASEDNSSMGGFKFAEM